jgi:hypothetical protein
MVAGAKEGVEGLALLLSAILKGLYSAVALDAQKRRRLYKICR